MIPVHDFAEVRENYWVRAILSEISRLTEHTWPENVFSFTEGRFLGSNFQAGVLLLSGQAKTPLLKAGVLQAQAERKEKILK